MAEQNEVLQSVARDIGTINTRIAEAEYLISALRDAGEDTAAREADLRSLKIRKEKWERMLQTRGYSIPS